MYTTETDSFVGGVAQVHTVTTALTVTKANDIALIVVGHVTRDGAIAGPRSLEHLVDVVLHFEGDRNHPMRIVHGVKNQFSSPTKPRVSSYTTTLQTRRTVLDQRPTPVAGTAITVTLDGK